MELKLELKLINKHLLNALSDRAGTAPRKRTNHNLHSSPQDRVQRLCIAAEPGSYFRPSRHVDPDTWEVIVVLRGAFVLLLFDETGSVQERVELSAAGAIQAAEIPPRTWHTLAVLEPGSAFFEVKEGPYHPIAEKDFASWAPQEGSPDAQRFVEWFHSAEPGASPPRA